MRFPRRASVYVLLALGVQVAGGCSRVEWHDPYVALESPEASGRGTPEQERLRDALARVESAPPQGLENAPRRHPRGSFVGLHFQGVDADGSLREEKFVRAIVPALPDPPVDRKRGPPADVIAADAAMVLPFGGRTGIAGEWILRMEPGRRYRLATAPLTLQDAFEREPAEWSIAGGVANRTSPQYIYATLIGVCRRPVRLGEATRIQFAPNAIAPVPIGLARHQWLQVDDCPQLAWEASRLASLDGVAPPRVSDHRSIIRAARSAQAGLAALRVDETALRAHGRPVVAQFSDLCRFDAAAGRWAAVGWHYKMGGTLLVPDPQRVGAGRDRYLLDFGALSPGELYWVRWRVEPEQDRAAQADRPAALEEGSALLLSGPVACDARSVATPRGAIVACVPDRGRAEVRAVPDPQPACTSRAPEPANGVSPTPTRRS